MAKAIPNPEIPQNGAHSKFPWKSQADEQAARQDPLFDPDSPLAGLKLWGADSPPVPGLDDVLSRSQSVRGPLSTDSDTGDGNLLQGDVDLLRMENNQLRRIIGDFEEKQKFAKEWESRSKEYEGLLEEKTQLIRELHVKNKELEEARPVVPPTPKEEELIAMSEELDRERCKFQQEQRQFDEVRKQFKEDEQEMSKQMREMEIQMARERADFARRRSELQRMVEEIRRELENAEKNGQLSQRLTGLRQRFHEVSNQKSSSGQCEMAELEGRPLPSSNGPIPAREDPKRKENGFLGRLFNK